MKAQCFPVTITNFLVSFIACACMYFIRCRSCRFEYQKWLWCDERLLSSSYICHGVGPLVDPFQSRVSRGLFKGLPWFLMPVGE